MCVVELQDVVWQYGWDVLYGGLIYGFDLDLWLYDIDKYFWVQVEFFVSVWCLWCVIGEECFCQQYYVIWVWSWVYLVDYYYGVWFCILVVDGSKLEDIKLFVGKVDYYIMGVCWDVMEVGGLCE